MAWLLRRSFATDFLFVRQPFLHPSTLNVRERIRIAYRSGLRKGDKLISISDKKFTDANEASLFIQNRLELGGKNIFVVERDGKTMNIEIH